MAEAKTMTIDQAAEVCGISRSSAYRAAKAGQLPTIRLGRRLLVPVPALERMLEYGNSLVRANEEEHW